MREDNTAANETYLYAYDEMGNMLEKQTYVLSFFTTPEWILDWETFSYASSDLGKLYNSSFGYDALGNLTFDMEKCWSYTWDGRQLVDITADGGLPRFTFAYDSNGIRTQKGVAQSWDEWVYHDYTLDGTTILKETIYNEAYGMISDVRDIYYYYDENGSPIGLNWNGEDYYYYKNIFGDVLGIMDSAGSMVVRYTHDAWGNPISTTGAMASTLGKDNPFRYRGYYYDTETGLYYLNARYYNPEWGRFISPDPVLDTSTAFGCNLFNYCGNDPINRLDESGCFWGFICDVISLVSSIIEVCQNPDDPWAWVGLAMDAVDLLPVVSGLGEATRAIKTTDRIVENVDNLHDTAKAAGNATEATRKADILAKNKAKGRAFEKEKFQEFSETHLYATEQVTIKTTSGVKVRVDAIGLDLEGNIIIQEYKSSLTAPLTKNQKAVFGKECFSEGGVVVGKGNAYIGMVIPAGTKVYIIRPS